MRGFSIALLICGLAANALAQPISASELDVEGAGEADTADSIGPPVFGSTLCNLLWQDPTPIGPIRDASLRSGDPPSVPASGAVALRDLVATPALARLPVELGAGTNGWERRIRLTVNEERPLVFAADRAIGLQITDLQRGRMAFDTFTAPEPDDRMCNQVRSVALVTLAPGEYRVTIESNASGTMGLVVAHLPGPPPPPPAPPQRTPGPSASDADVLAAQRASGAVTPIPDRPAGGDRGGRPTSSTNRSTVVIPCTYDVRFVSFTPRSAPAGDRRGEFEFQFTVGANAPVTLDDFGNSVGVDQTRFVHHPLGQVLVPCNDVAQVPLHLTGREADDWFVFGFVNPDETADHTESIALDCGNGPAEVVQTYTLEFRRGSGAVRHTVDVQLAFRQANQTESCDEYDDPDELSPCTYDVALASLEHVASPASDKNGRFNVLGAIAEGFGLKYPVGESTYVEVKRGETAPLNLDLARYTVPCGETWSIPVRVLALEDDVLGDDLGELTQTVALSCPPANSANQVIYPLDLAQQNGTVKHHIRVTTRARIDSQDFCAPEPTIAACVFGVDGYDVTHTDSPSADKRGEFSIGSDLGYGNEVQWNVHTVERGETSSITLDQGTIEVPCGDTVDAPLRIQAREYDIIDLWVNGWEIAMPHEYGGATVPLQFTCPPAVPSTSHSTHVVLRNGRGDRKHAIDLDFATRFDNPDRACFPLQVPAPEPPPTACMLELDLWKFAHENGSTGDKDGDFEFEFEVTYLAGAHPTGAGHDMERHRVYRGYEKTIAEPIVFPDLGVPGASRGPYFEVPVGVTVPISVRIDVTEKDAFGDDKGWRETTVNLNCDMATPHDVTLPIKINDTKHLGVITLRVQPY